MGVRGLGLRFWVFDCCVLGLWCLGVGCWVWGFRFLGFWVVGFGSLRGVVDLKQIVLVNVMILASVLF